MAYRFNGTADRVEFSKAPFNGTTIGNWTSAILFKTISVPDNSRYLFYLGNSAGTTTRLGVRLNDVTLLGSGGVVGAPSTGVWAMTTGTWYLLAVTKPSGASIPRFHLWNGSVWTHVNGTTYNDYTVAGTDRLSVFGNPVGSAGLCLNGDCVCVGWKKANSTDLQVQAISPTSFQSWRDFGFDWLIGFDTSLQSAGVLHDQGPLGTGDEIAKTGTSVVSDPPGWSWTGGGGGPNSGFLGFM